MSNNSFEIITVATHKEGKLNDLINNKFNIPITVLGFGQKWTGFNMKYQLAYDHIKNLPDDKIIIFLDGFDSEIKKSPYLALDTFKQHNYKLIFSLEPGSGLIGGHKFVFDTCKHNKIGNTGLYMGYVKYLKIFLQETFKNKCKDDQVVMNRLCSKYDFIDVDINQNIFQNLKIVNVYNYNNKASFISFPGTFSFKRFFRGFVEYSQFFILIILALYFSLLYLFLKLIKSKNKRNLCIIFTTIIFVFWFKNMDYSCVN